jgi:hypothetical protein
MNFHSEAFTIRFAHRSAISHAFIDRIFQSLLVNT